MFQRCQHTVRPDARFDPVPSPLGLSGLFSPFGHSRQGVFLPSGHSISTFLGPFAPQALPCIIAHMDPLTPAGTALRSNGHEHRLSSPTGLPASRTRPLQPFRPQPPGRPCRRFVTRPLSASGTPCGFRLRHSDRGLAGRPGRIGFACATDWLLASCCSPPRLAATQLQSTNGRSVYATRGLPPLRPSMLAGAQ